MGIFDTVRLHPALHCATCGKEIDQIQTKAFEPGLREYEIGDIITGSPIVNGVIREDLYCPSCNSTSRQVYFAIWHSLLVGICDTVDAAEHRIGNVDRAELIDYIAQHQGTALQWHDRFSRLYGELQNLHDYQKRAASGAAPSEDPTYFRIRDFLASADPLGELIRANKPVNPEDEQEVSSEEESG